MSKSTEKNIPGYLKMNNLEQRYVRLTGKNGRMVFGVLLTFLSTLSHKYRVSLYLEALPSPLCLFILLKMAKSPDFKGIFLFFA